MSKEEVWLKLFESIRPYAETIGDAVDETNVAFTAFAKRCGWSLL